MSFSFDPTAGLDDFDRVNGARDGWSRMMSDLLDAMNHGHFPQGSPPGALDELEAWGRSEADLRFYNPASKPIPRGSTDANVTWQALPTSFDAQFPSKGARYSFLDEPHPDPATGRATRVQDEYCEWVVATDGAGRVTGVTFTSEPSAYYEFLADPPEGVDRDGARALLLALYAQACKAAVPIEDLFASGRYDPYNAWNSRFAVHMQQANNTLGAEVNIAARAALVREDVRTGRVRSDAADLIACARYGDPSRQSDPSIGSNVNTFARQNRFVTLQNPVGLYMTGLDTSGWTTPDGADPQAFWRVLRGDPGTGPGDARIVRAEYAVGDGRGYAVSDVEIGGVAIRHGAEIAAQIGMRLGVTVSPPADLPPPRPIGCLRDTPKPLDAPAAADAARPAGMAFR